ncbi:hypothetical protein ACFQU2_03685 [Siccirubricoccus deserti]
MRFQDQAVLVTGGGSGIGQQVCYAAARRARGSRSATSTWSTPRQRPPASANAAARRWRCVSMSPTRLR